MSYGWGQSQMVAIALCLSLKLSGNKSSAYSSSNHLSIITKTIRKTKGVKWNVIIWNLWQTKEEGQENKNKPCNVWQNTNWLEILS